MLIHWLGIALAAEGVPSTAAAVEGFVPSGYTIEKRLDGELDGRPGTDVVLLLWQIQGGEDGPGGERILLLLQATPEGYRRIGVAQHLAQCTTCGGAFYATMPAEVDLQLQGPTTGPQVVVLSQMHGSRMLVEETWRMRYDAPRDATLVIGIDVDESDRVLGTVSKTSTNLLTGARRNSGPRGGVDWPASVWRVFTAVPKPPDTLETYDAKLLAVEALR